MCGIAGVFTSQQHATQRQLVADIVAAQIQRGPDHQDIIECQQNGTELIFGHTRLSIIDLSDHANQPMWDTTERYCLVYNGEIYNYLEIRQQLIARGCVFKTNSDTEVLLQALIYDGIQAIQQFNGPFAFAWYDRMTNKLTLVRDRFGVKPLYYYQDSHGFYFASSMRTLAQHFKLDPNYQYLSNGLNFLCYETQSTATAYAHLFTVQSGHYLTIQFIQNRVHVKTQCYYDFHQAVLIRQEELAQVCAVAQIDRVQHHLSEAIKLRLRADVPIGIALSGGLDSAIVAAIASGMQRQLVAFCFGDPMDRTTEGYLAQQVASLHGVRTEYIQFDTVTPQLFLDTLHIQEAPFMGLSIIAQNLIYQCAHQHQIKVILGGQGADESFMGYRKFLLFYLHELMRSGRISSAMVHGWQSIPTLLSEFKRRSLMWAGYKRHFKVSGRPMRLLLQEQFTPENDIASLRAHFHSGIEKQICDVTLSSLPTLLRYEDRNSMANGIESRLPFMDYQLLELGVALPTAQKLNKGYGKYVLRELAAGLVPDEIRLARYKRGFDVNTQQLLARGLGNILRGLLNDYHSRIKPYLPAQSVSQLFSDAQLKNNPIAFGEAITLLWLATKDER